MLVGFAGQVRLPVHFMRLDNSNSTFQSFSRVHMIGTTQEVLSFVNGGIGVR